MRKINGLTRKKPIWAIGPHSLPVSGCLFNTASSHLSRAGMPSSQGPDRSTLTPNTENESPVC